MNQNSYALVDSSKATARSYGAILSRHDSLGAAIQAAREGGSGLAIVHPLCLLGRLYYTTTDAAMAYFSDVTHDMRGLPIFDAEGRCAI